MRAGSASAARSAALYPVPPAANAAGTVRAAPKIRKVITGAASISSSVRQPAQYRALLERLGSQICATAKSPATTAPCQRKCNNVQPSR
ncbi:MAG: hypothetical protein ABSA47_14665 [Verrucomicrobiota bacterium]